MTGQSRRARSFLGRPEAAYPGFVPGDAARRAADTPRVASRAGRLWLVQALTGAFLLVFMGVHLVAQHFLAPGGLRDYAAVVEYLRSPLALVAEIGLLISVVVHAVLGLRSTLVEIVGMKAIGRVSIVLAVVGVVVIGYAIWLTIAVIGAPTGG